MVDDASIQLQQQRDGGNLNQRGNCLTAFAGVGAVYSQTQPHFLSFLLLRSVANEVLQDRSFVAKAAGRAPTGHTLHTDVLARAFRLLSA